MSVNVYEMVTNKIIEQLEKGVVAWRKGWTGFADGAISRSTGKPYSFINQMMLSKSGEYLTFNQVKEAGGKVRKGEKSEQVVFYSPLEIEDEAGNKKTIPYLKYYNVFHISQCDDVEPKYNIEEMKREFEPIETAERTIDGYCSTKNVKLIHQAGNRAFYAPMQDYVQLPKKEQFKSNVAYYETAFHELVHSTGHHTRLNRFESGVKLASFGSEEYSKEELVAEIGSAFLLNNVGLEVKEIFENQASYIASWLKVLKNDKNLIVSAAGKAEKACKMIMECFTSEKLDEIEKVETKKQKNESEEVKGEMKLEKGIENINKMLQMDTTKMYEALLSMREELIEELRMSDVEKKGTPKKEITIIKNMMKANKCNENFQKAQSYGDRFAFTDGHRLFITNTDLGYEISEKPLNIENIMKIERLHRIKFDLADLKIFIKENKGIKNLKPYIVDINGELMGFKANYLVDAIDFLGTDEFEISSRIQPAYASNGEKEALVLPVSIKGESERPNGKCEIIK